MAINLLRIEGIRRQLHRAFKTGRFDRKSWNVLGGLSQDDRQVWLEFQEATGMAVRERMLYLGLTSEPAENPKLMDIALKAAESAQDRVRGKPTEHQQHSGRLTVLFGGLDPSKFPDGEEGRHGAPPPPPVATRRTWEQANLISIADTSNTGSNTQDGSRSHEDARGRTDRDESNAEDLPGLPEDSAASSEEAS